jgi:surface antigen
MPNGFHIDKRQIKKLTDELQREFNKHPVHVPLNAAPKRAGATTRPQTIVHHHGDTVTVHGNNAQIAVNSHGDVTQSQPATGTVAPGFEALAELLGAVLSNAPTFKLPPENEADLSEAVSQALNETTKETPDRTLIRRSVTFVKGALTPVLAGVSTGVTDETAELARKTIDALSAALT